MTSDLPSTEPLEGYDPEARAEAVAEEAALRLLNERLDRDARLQETHRALVIAELEGLKARDEAKSQMKKEQRASLGIDETFYDLDGFLAALPDPVPVWGDGPEILWASGEAMIIVADPGVGKTTAAVQVVRGLLGLDQRVLGYTVQPAQRVLYMAADRPRQIGNFFELAFPDPRERAVIKGRLVIRKGPPVDDMLDQMQLLQLARDAGASHVILDSLKDFVADIADGPTAAAWNTAIQTAVSAGVEVLMLHHSVKNWNGTLDGMYGSRWLSAGVGTVLSMRYTDQETLEGEVTAKLIKQSMNLVELRLLRNETTRLFDPVLTQDEADKLAIRAAVRTEARSKTSISRVTKMNKGGRLVRLLEELVKDGIVIETPAADETRTLYREAALFDIGQSDH